MLQLNKLGESRPDTSYLHLNEMKIRKHFAFILMLYLQWVCAVTKKKQKQKTIHTL